MGLSEALQERMERDFGPGTEGAAQFPLPAYNPQFHRGLRWYCPRDGVRLNEQLECPTCGKHLRGYVRVLVELHPHCQVE